MIGANDQSLQNELHEMEFLLLKIIYLIRILIC